MNSPSENNGFEIKKVESGFLGEKVIYFLWFNKKLIAHSLDKVKWKMATWIGMHQMDLNQIKEIHTYLNK